VTRGAFITLEGGEGVGKSTSLTVIAQSLTEQGHGPLLTREPGGTALGERVREWILEGDHGELGADVEALLMFAARAQHLREVIRPALDAGTWVVCDRFTDATLAYQGAGRGADLRFLRAVARDVHAGVEPDLTLLLDAPVDVGLGRIEGRDHDHFEREDRAFFERVRAGYLELAQLEPDRFRVIDASLMLDAVAAEIRRHLTAFVERFERDEGH
jgi:dTMP kinase